MPQRLNIVNTVTVPAFCFSAFLLFFLPSITLQNVAHVVSNDEFILIGCRSRIIKSFGVFLAGASFGVG